MLLSATLGDTEGLEKWLEPCDVAASSLRRPVLKRAIVSVEDEEEWKTCVTASVREILAVPGTSVLMFVYQTKSAEAMARELTGELGELCGAAGAYHARLSAATKSSDSRYVSRRSNRGASLALQHWRWE
ncbi:MAG: hypothetical protein R3F19_12025 [Verrucomicrobiales bacterium]